MHSVETLKADLIAAIDRANPDGSYSDEAVDGVHAAIDRLLPHTPLPRPIDDEAKVAAPWATLFAQFGPKHSAGKPVAHETTFATLSFNTLPKLPLRLLELAQEIHHESKDYNNVHIIEPLEGGLRAHLTVYGRYRIEPDHPQRYIVEFYKAAVAGLDGAGEDDVRRAFGFAEDQPLSADIKPPKLHSDVVYCDDSLRINFGSMGGVYVLRRTDGPGVSVDFS